MKPSSVRSASARLLPLAATAALGLALAGCYVIPIDPRTGQPYPTAVTREAGYPAPYTGAAVQAPAAVPTGPSQLNVRLYPINAQANKAGMLSALVVDNNSGHGSFSVPYLGDTLQGESTRVDASYASFGHVHADVLGPTPRSFSSRRGIANAHGSRGVNAQCEYVLTGPGSGTGVCEFSDGAYYQMHFGG